MMDKRHIESDEALLNSFFAEHRQIIADNGFTDRVMASLPEREDVKLAEAMRLRRWSWSLNVFGVVAGLTLLIGLGFFGRVLELLETGAVRLLWGIMHYDYDTLLVQLILFLRSLPELLPSSTQLLVVLLAIYILTFEGAKKLRVEG